MKNLLGVLSATLIVLGTATDVSVAQRLVTPLETDLRPLVSDFNARRSVPRLVVILSPT